MFGHFLEQISETGIPALIIAGNHDSPERLGFAGPLLEKGRIFLSSFPPSKEGKHLKKVTLKDRWGNVNFYLFPFMKPGYVRPLLRAEGREYEDTYDGAFRAVLERETIDTSERNVILCHQFLQAVPGIRKLRIGDGGSHGRRAGRIGKFCSGSVRLRGSGAYSWGLRRLAGRQSDTAALLISIRSARSAIKSQW